MISRPVKDTVLPLSAPVTGVDGRRMDEIIIEKDTFIILSIFNSNRDPTIWGPDSYEWKPERWLSPLLDTVLEARTIYSHQWVQPPDCRRSTIWSLRSAGWHSLAVQGRACRSPTPCIWASSHPWSIEDSSIPNSQWVCDQSVHWNTR